MTWSVIVGNGLTIDATRHCGLGISPSHPWDWPITNPYKPNQRLLDVMPKLKAHLQAQGSLAELDVYSALQSIVQDTQTRPPFAPQEHPIDQDFIHMEACHYLRFAYAWFSEQLDSSRLQNWQWCEWLIQNGQNIETILSYNYDLVLELVMKLASLGKVHGWTQQNPPFGPGLVPQEPQIYWDESEGDRCVIHVAKPHGSCNFSSWVRREASNSSGPLPLYPIDGPYVLRANAPIKVLNSQEIFKPTSVVDLVLPGEWSCWGGDESTRLEWAAKHKEIFIKESEKARKLLIVGFGYGDPDRPEFNELIERMHPFREVHIVHPACKPSNELVQALRVVSQSSVSIWSGPPWLLCS